MRLYNRDEKYNILPQFIRNRVGMTQTNAVVAENRASMVHTNAVVYNNRGGMSFIF